tara:strand:- start:47 stop:205 length:159 start_codon:yes stop_codon:yes gene_type:complete
MTGYFKKSKLADQVIKEIKADLKDPEFQGMELLHEVLMRVPNKWLNYYLGEA